MHTYPTIATFFKVKLSIISSFILVYLHISFSLLLLADKVLGGISARGKSNCMTVYTDALTKTKKYRPA